MSNINKNSYNYNSIYNMGLSEGFGYPFTSTGHHQNHNPFMYNQLQNPTGLDPYSHMSFTNCLSADAEYYDTLSTAFDLYCSSSHEVPVCPVSNNNDHNYNNSSSENLMEPDATTSGTATETLLNASGSCSSEGALGEHSSKSKEDLQPKGCEDEDLKSKEVYISIKPFRIGQHLVGTMITINREETLGHTFDFKGKTKGVKKEGSPRFAFVTESEVDNLEDGYKWRKYGQKAVKNSPFPRSYYRCTVQKCTVKKRIERSSKDSSVVVTTYEGQHNHPCPASLQSFAAMLPPSLLSPTTFAGFPQDFLSPASSHQDHLINHQSPAA